MSDKKKKTLEVEGFIYKIFDTVTFDSGFKKREFILETRTIGADGKEYKNLTKFGAAKKYISILDNIGIGSEVVVAFSLDGREWESPEQELVYITSLRAWDITVVNNTSQERKEAPKEQSQEMDYTQELEPDDLPF